jgi:outer membrane lipoprotein-sorting protein
MSAGLFGAFLIAGAICGQAKDETTQTDLPKVEAVMEKYHEAQGGKAAYAKIKTMKTTGSLEIPGAGIKATIVIEQEAPNKQYSVVEFEQVGKIESGTDGKVVWEINPMTGPRVKEGAEAAIELRNAVIDDTAIWKDQYESAKVEGTEDVDGKTCYKVTFTPKKDQGAPEINFYDKDSGLLLKGVRLISSPQGELEITTAFSDYKKVGDLTVPHKMVQSVGGQELPIVIESVEINPELDKKHFELPEDIKKLVKEG